MESNSKSKSKEEKVNSTKKKVSIKIKGNKISFSQESEISDVTKENNKFFSPVIKKKYNNIYYKFNIL